MEDSELVDITSRKLKMSRDGLYSTSLGVLHAISAADECIRSCVSATVAPGQVKALVGGAALMGLSPSVFGWDLQDFVESCHLPLEHDVTAALQLLAVEYDDDGVNESFRSAIQGTICVIGSADKVTQQMYNSLGLGSVPLGGCVGKLDCHVGGVPGSCSDMAACIRYAPTGASIFQFSCISDTDVVTLNGNRITPASGIFPLQHEDICSVGARVFAFVMPKDYALVKE